MGELHVCASWDVREWEVRAYYWRVPPPQQNGFWDGEEITPHIHFTGRVKRHDRAMPFVARRAAEEGISAAEVANARLYTEIDRLEGFESLLDHALEVARRAEYLQLEAQKLRHRLVLELRAGGLTNVDIGSILGRSNQRISRLASEDFAERWGD